MENAMKKIIVSLLFSLLFLLLLSVVVKGEQALINTKAPEFVLFDQYDRQYSLQSFAGRPLVLIASDKKGEEQNRRWVASIRKKYGKGVRILGVADVRTVPFFLKGRIRNDFKKDTNSILLDWQGNFFKSYGLAKGVSNVVLIDSSGYVRYLYAGGPSDDAREQLFKEIETIGDRK
jgi:cytochrome oxidase Cu insertion factor (SCO1/SenC/PrrC family)